MPVLKGSIMNTNGKNVPAIAAEVNTITGVLRLQFSNGDALALQLSELSDDIRQQATLHGLKQKLVDAGAISRNPSTGRSATVEDKIAAIHAVYDRLLAGQWNKTREGGVVGGLLFRALCRLHPTKTPEAILAFLAGKTDAEKTALRANAKVAAIITEIRAEAGVAGNIDTDGMLDELNND